MPSQQLQQLATPTRIQNQPLQQTTQAHIQPHYLQTSSPQQSRGQPQVQTMSSSQLQPSTPSRIQGQSSIQQQPSGSHGPAPTVPYQPWQMMATDMPVMSQANHPGSPLVTAGVTALTVQQRGSSAAPAKVSFQVGPGQQGATTLVVLEGGTKPTDSPGVSSRKAERSDINQNPVPSPHGQMMRGAGDMPPLRHPETMAAAKQPVSRAESIQGQVTKGRQGDGLAQQQQATPAVPSGQNKSTNQGRPAQETRGKTQPEQGLSESDQQQV